MKHKKHPNPDVPEDEDQIPVDENLPEVLPEEEEGGDANAAQEETAKLTAELQALKEKLMYLEADYQNYRKRVVKDISEARLCGTAGTLEPFLTVFDFLGMAKTAADARKMLEAAKRSGKKLTIGYQNRCRPDSLLLKKAVDRGDLGEIYFAKAHAIRRRAVPTWGVFLNEYEQGGGPLIDIGTHALDLTLWMMNNYKPKAVLGQTFKKLGKQTETGNAWGDWDPEKFTVEDSAFGFITMQDGATIILESSWALNTLDVQEAKTTLCGTKAGADMVDGLRFNMIDFNKQTIKKPSLESGGVAFYSGAASDDCSDVEAAQWIDSIINDTTPLVLPEQALVVTEILEAIYTSAKTGEAVYF